MKICPTCRETYTDDNLNFCLTDGAFLTELSGNEPKTILMDEPRITNQTNFGQPTNFGQQGYQPPSAWQSPQNIQQQQGNYPAYYQQQSQTLPTVSLVLGILGVLTICCWGGIPLGAGAVITGVIAMNQEKADPAKYGGRGLALGGIIAGGIALLIGFGFLLLAIIGNIR